MPSRRRSREQALQILYLRDIRDGSIDDALSEFSLLADDETETGDRPDDFTQELVSGVARQSQKIDSRIAEHSEHWRLPRMPVVDRNILRLAVYEMLFVGTPKAVVIDEALELARKFSGEASRSFVNGVLDGIRRGLKEKPEASGA